MTKNSLPPPKLLRKLLEYEPETGLLFWKARGENSQWDGRFAGKEAFTTTLKSGYRFGRIYYAGFYAHRVAWAIYYDAWPVFQIDHLNGIRSDNRIENLRSATQSENSKNSAIPSHNTSGVVGVSWDKKAKKWASHIGVYTPDYITRSGHKRNSRKLHLGYFDTLEDAKRVRKRAEQEHGFQEGHGRARGCYK